MANPVLVIMAAGMGSRYGGLKQIDPIGPNGQILLDYSIYDAHRAGFDRVVFIIRPELHEAFEDAIGKKARRFMQVDYAYQTLDNLPDGLTAPEGREKPLGTAHAVWCAKELTAGCPIAVINADDFYGADAFHKMYDYLASAQDDDKFRYAWSAIRSRTRSPKTARSPAAYAPQTKTVCSHISSSAPPFTAMRTASSATMRTAMHPPVRLRRHAGVAQSLGIHPFLPALA